MSEPMILCSECFDAAGFEQVRGIRPRSICAKCGRECLGYGAEAEKSDPSVPLSAIRALVQQWEERLAVEKARLAECYKLPYNLPAANVRSATTETMTKFIAELAALCPAPPEDQP